MHSTKEKQKKLFKGRTVISVILTLMFLLSLFPPLTANANELNSNDYRSQLINLGKSGSDSQQLENALDSLSGDQLKTLGVFISNFYVPFSTQVGKGRTEEEDKAIKDQIVKTLTETGSFDEEIARVITNAVLNVSSDPKPLYFGYSTDSGKEYKPARVGSKNGRQATFYEFLDQISGYSIKNDTGIPYPDSSNSRVLDIYNDPNYGYKKGSTKNRGALYWDDSSNGSVTSQDKIVFDWNPAKNEGGGQTASQTVMATIYQYLDKENSVGASFLDYTEEERGNGSKGDVMTKLVESNKLNGRTIESLYKRSMYAWTMWVDAFGNILVDTGARQYVVVPAAMNPYVFKKNGNDGNGNAYDYGRAVPVNNLISVTLAGQNKLLQRGTTPTDKTGTFNVGSIFSQFPDYGKVKAVYTAPSTGQMNWDEGIGVDWGSALLDGLTTQYGMLRYGLDGKSIGEWVTLGDKPSGTTRFTNGLGGENKGGMLKTSFAYGFNSADQSLSETTYVSAPRSGLNPNPKHVIISDLTAFDTYALNSSEYLKHDGSIDTFSNISLFKSDGSLIMDVANITEGSAFGESLESDRNKLNTASNEVMKNYSANFYVSYILAGLGASEKAGFSIGFSRFPTYDGRTVLEDINSEESRDLKEQELMNLAYYFLHPTEGLDYFARWAKSKIGSLLVGWHNDMTGANESSNTTGLTRYVGFTGFTTMPSLNDMAWTNWMVTTYLNWGIYLIIAIVVVMLFYVVIGEISLQRAILGSLLFSMCLTVPPTAINSTVEITNAVSNAIYSNKFTYWGVMQLQTFSNRVDDLALAGEEGRTEDYTQSLMQLQGGSDGLFSNSSSLGNGVSLKWMSPKKDNYLYQIQKEFDESFQGQTGALSMLAGGFLQDSLSGERYVDTNNAMYLYRTYTDISNYSRFYYGNLMGDNVYGTGSVSHDIGDITSSLSTVGMNGQLNTYLNGTGEDSLYERKSKGFINDTQDALRGASTEKKKAKRIYAPLSSSIVSKASNVNISNVELGEDVGVSQSVFNATIRNFNNHESQLSTQLESDESSSELASTSSFALYTESPFYYFSWFLYDNGMSTQSGSTGSFRDLMLSENDSFFYNYQIDNQSSGYGELKDYFDMGTLFTTVIPYLRTVNTPLKQWGSIHGAEPYKDIPTTEDEYEAYMNESPESYQKYWHNISLARLYNMYTPWVDAMYDTKYSRPETIEYGGEKQTVNDPINPASYEIRPMIFSESEMAYYGLKEYNLTEVERKILKVQRQTREDLLQLVNYHTFHDTVLNSATAMLMTFNFNKEFSETKVLGESFVLYPQSFELKNFTYDAYLRLILAESTGENLQNVDSEFTLYQRIVEKSSILTGILLVVGDFISVYIIPLMKFVFLVMIFLLSVITIFVKAVRAEISLRMVVWDSLLKPLILFCVVTVLHALAISVFMSNGSTDVTGDLTHTVSLGDPSMTLLAIMGINIVAVVLYSLISFNLIKSLLTYGKLAGSLLGGVVASMGSYAGSTFKNVTSNVQGRVLNDSSSAGGNPSVVGTPEDRGRTNITPELYVYNDNRSVDQSRMTDTDGVNSSNSTNSGIDINETIRKGREKVETEDSEVTDSSRLESEAKKKQADETLKKYNLE